MAEQQRFEHGFGDRRAIDRHEGLVAPRAAVVDELREDFLAGPGRAVDQHRNVGLRQPVGQRENRERFRIGRDRPAAGGGERDERGEARFGNRIGIGQPRAAAHPFDRRGIGPRQRHRIGQRGEAGFGMVGKMHGAAREERGDDPRELARQWRMHLFEPFGPFDRSHFKPPWINQLPFAPSNGGNRGKIRLMVNGEMSLSINTYAPENAHPAPKIPLTRRRSGSLAAAHDGVSGQPLKTLWEF